MVAQVLKLMQTKVVVPYLLSLSPGGPDRPPGHNEEVVKQPRKQTITN